MNRKAALPSAYVFFFCVLVVFVILDWFVSDPLRAGMLDRYILFSNQESAHFYYSAVGQHRPAVFLNPNAKPLYTVLASAFLSVFPFGLFSLKVLNSLLSLAAAAAAYRVSERLSQNRFAPALSVIFILTSPLYVLASIASVTEILFALFLIAAIYLLYVRNYLVSALAVSLLPLIRQEGVLYLALWPVFLMREKRARLALILPLPFLAWALLNRFLLGHSLPYSLFIGFDVPPPAPSSAVMSAAEFKAFFPAILCQPLFLLFLPSLMAKMKDRAYAFLTIPLLCHVALLVVGAAVQFLIIKQVSCDFRYLIPLIPPASIVLAAAVSRMPIAARKKTLFAASLSVFLTAALVIGIRGMQSHPRVAARRLSGQQERSLREAVSWLNQLLEESGHPVVFYSGELTTDAAINRIKVYLRPDIALYPVKEGREVFDPVTFTTLRTGFRDPSSKGVILVLDPVREERLLTVQGTELLRGFPDIPLYVFRKY